MGTNAPAGFKQGRMKIVCRRFSRICADRLSYRSPLMCVNPRLIVFVCLLVASLSISAQTTLDDLRNKIAVGSTEEKRSALFEIRSRRTEEASRIAIPTLSDKIDVVRATAVSSVIFLPQDEA